MLLFIYALLAASTSVSQAAGNLVFGGATILNRTTTPLASNVYQNITNGTLSWTFWLQLSSLNQNLSKDVTIVSMASGSTFLHSLYLYKGKYLAVRAKTSLATEAAVYGGESPPFDQWFYAGFSIDANTREVKFGWRKSGRYVMPSGLLSGTPVTTFSHAVLTLQYSTALGYLTSSLVSDRVLDGINDLGMSSVPPPDSMRYAGGQLTGGTIFESSSPLLLSCPSNLQLGAIDFASYGHPIGLFPNFATNPQCNVSALAYVQEQCLGRSSCSVAASNQIFGDPCRGQVKWLCITARCSPALSSSPGPTSPVLSARTSASVVVFASMTATSRARSSPSPRPSSSSVTVRPSSPLQTKSSSLTARSRTQTAGMPTLQSARQVFDQSGRSGIQNAIRIKIPLGIDASARSPTWNRNGARLAVRHLSAALQVDASQFVLVDLISNKTRSFLTLTILAGVTNEKLAEGRRIAQSLQSLIQDPFNPLRQDPLLNTTQIPVAIGMESVSVQLCPSGVYVCLSDSTCPTPTPVVEASHDTFTIVAATAASVILTYACIMIVALCWRCQRRSKPAPTNLVTLPVSNTSFNQYQSADVYLPTDSPPGKYDNRPLAAQNGLDGRSAGYF